MKERPILFNGEMVRAVLDGRKSQTRRVIKFPDGCDEIGLWQDTPHIVSFGIDDHCSKIMQPQDAEKYSRCPYGQPGDRLWVRETFQYTGPELNIDPGYVYRATDPDWDSMEEWTWKPSIFMPREASRILLEVTDVRVERVQAISHNEACREGVLLDDEQDDPVSAFERIWDSINSKRGYGWDVNPWVWVVSFQEVK